MPLPIACWPRVLSGWTLDLPMFKRFVGQHRPAPLPRARDDETSAASRVRSTSSTTTFAPPNGRQNCGGGVRSHSPADDLLGAGPPNARTNYY